MPEFRKATQKSQLKYLFSKTSWKTIGTSQHLDVYHNTVSHLYLYTKVNRNNKICYKWLRKVGVHWLTNTAQGAKLIYFIVAIGDKQHVTPLNSKNHRAFTHKYPIAATFRSCTQMSVITRQLWEQYIYARDVVWKNGKL